MTEVHLFGGPRHGDCVRLSFIGARLLRDMLDDGTDGIYVFLGTLLDGELVYRWKQPS